MKITSNTVVSIDYIVTDENGQVLDTTNGQDAMEVLIGHSNIVHGLPVAVMPAVLLPHHDDEHGSMRSGGGCISGCRIPSDEAP